MARALCGVAMLGAAAGGVSNAAAKSSAGGRGAETNPPVLDYTDVAGAETAILAMSAYLGRGADSARNSRRIHNKLILGLDTYTLLALGLGYHPANAFVTALAANTVRRHDAIETPGGEAPYITAIQGVMCVSARLTPARNWAAFRPRVGEAKLFTGDLAYADNISASREALAAIYFGYRRATSQEPLSSSEAPGAADRGDQALRSPQMNVAARASDQIPDADAEKLITSMTAASDSVRKCAVAEPAKPAA